MYYIHLTKIEWASSWINGGKIPISLASKYLSDDRINIMTPDETVHRDHSDSINYETLNKAVDLDSKGIVVDISRVDVYGDTPRPGSKFITFAEGAKNVILEDVSFELDQGAELAAYGHYSQQIKDALILSVTTDSSLNQSLKLEKECCIRVVSIPNLKSIIDQQLGVKGVFQKCLYTSGMKRNHYLKSTEDEWQKEYRIVWEVPEDFIEGLKDKSLLVDIPANSGELVDMK